MEQTTIIKTFLCKSKYGHKIHHWKSGDVFIIGSYTDKQARRLILIELYKERQRKNMKEGRYKYVGDWNHRTCELDNVKIVTWD